MAACTRARTGASASWPTAPDGAESVIAEDVNSNDIAVNQRGEIYFSDPEHKQVWFIDARKDKRVVHEGIAFPNGLRFLARSVSADGGRFSAGKWVWSFQVQPDGSLSNGQPFYRLETPDESSASSADGMAVDTEGYLYVATRIGIQVCDQPGRVMAIINKPQPGPISNVVFAGPDMQTLYVTAGDKVFRRHVRRKGTLPWTPLKPPTPQL